MAAPIANISRDMFDERLRYFQNVAQQAKPLVDADQNSYMNAVYEFQRRIQQLIGNGSPNGAFNIEGFSGTNDFRLKGGNSTAEGAGRLFVQGHSAILDRDVTYLGTPVSGIDGEAQRSIFPKITDITFNSGSGETTITDSSANYATNELVGRTLNPNVEVVSSDFAIVSNTTNQIVVTGDATATGAVNSRYRLNLSTPASNRTDFVWINIFLDEIDETEDPDLLHTFGVPAAAQLRLQLQQFVFVREGDPTPLASYVDADGLPHFTFLLGTIDRTSGVPTIDPGMPTVLIPIITPIAGKQEDRETLPVTSNGQTSFILSKVPNFPEKVFLRFQGVGQEYGATKDYTVSGNVLTWNDNEFTLEIGDFLEINYLQ